MRCARPSRSSSRPRINPALSPYLERLTGITTDILREQGRDFAAAYRAFLDFAGGGVCAAFGRDELVFEENRRLYGMAAPADEPEFRDLRPWFGANGMETCGLHSCDIGPNSACRSTGGRTMRWRTAFRSWPVCGF